MKRLLPILILVALHSACADDAANKSWETRLGLLTNGMTRAQVEAIFPDAGGIQRLMSSGSGYSITYNIDDDTAISLAYDYTGYQTDSEGKTIYAQNPSNRLGKIHGLLDQKKRKPIILNEEKR